MSRPLWGHPVGHDDPACRRRFPPWRAGEPPTKVGGLRGDILFKSKEYPLALPKKDSRGDFVFSPGTPLKRPKGAEAPFGNPDGGVDGETGFTGDGGWGRGACGYSGCFGFAGDEVGDGLVDLEPALGVHCLWSL